MTDKAAQDAVAGLNAISGVVSRRVVAGVDFVGSSNYLVAPLTAPEGVHTGTSPSRRATPQLQ